MTTTRSTPLANAVRRPSVLANLRRLVPDRTMIFSEALQIAELQAHHLGRLLDPQDDGIGDHHFVGMPRITVSYEDLPVSGTSHWNGSEWVIAISCSDSVARQRFTLLHEFKHILDHGRAHLLYRGDHQRSAKAQAEAVADYFAGCALASKRRLKSAWGNGIQRSQDLADHFGLSVHAIQVRLAQTGLSKTVDREPAPRCARPVQTSKYSPQQFRIASSATHSRRLA